MILNVLKQVVKKYMAKTSPVKYLRSIGVNVGENCKIFSLEPGSFGSEPYLVSIGNDVIITNGVKFVTHDGSSFLFRKEHPDLDVMGQISIGNNTFLGMNSIIMPGVTVGSNSIIGAMSLVSRSIPDGCVAAGNPAKVLMSTAEFKIRMLERSSGTGGLSESEKKEELLKMDVILDEKNRSWKKKID